MNLDKELEDKILERLYLVQYNIKNNTLNLDGSFNIKLELLNTEIGQLKDKISEEILLSGKKNVYLLTS